MNSSESEYKFIPTQQCTSEELRQLLSCNGFSYCFASVPFCFDFVNDAGCFLLGCGGPHLIQFIHFLHNRPNLVGAHSQYGSNASSIV